MKIKCSYCDHAIDAMSEVCPHCGAINDKAAQYANQHEQNMRMKEQARTEAYESVKHVQKKMSKVVIAVYVSIAVVMCLPVIIGIILAIANNGREQKERADRERQKQEQLQEEQRLKGEQEEELKAYNEEEISVSGLKTVAQKDLYYAIEIEEVVPYELNYDYKEKDWGAGISDDSYLRDDEHRVAIHIKLKNFQDKVSLYNDPSGWVKLYIEDENEDSIVIQDSNFLNGNREDNYYSGGKMISDVSFSNNFGKTLEHNQTMSWWVPVVVNKNSEKIILHFDYNMSITVDNPCAK